MLAIVYKYQEDVLSTVCGNLYVRDFHYRNIHTDQNCIAEELHNYNRSIDSNIGCLVINHTFFVIQWRYFMCMVELSFSLVQLSG